MWQYNCHEVNNKELTVMETEQSSTLNIKEAQIIKETY